MSAYKGFDPGLICREYQFVTGLNKTEKANCCQNGFHCAENPLDCLIYYSNIEQAEYWIVNAGGDMDEDGNDTKISCTELTILKKLKKEDLFLHGLVFMVDHPLRKWSSRVTKDKADAIGGYAVVRGSDPVARGRKGDILAFAKENPVNGHIVQIALAQIDGVNILPDTWYGADLAER